VDLTGQVMEVDMTLI